MWLKARAFFSCFQAGGSNDALHVRIPAGITRLFKSELDWNLYTSRQEGVADRRVSHAFRTETTIVLPVRVLHHSLPRTCSAAPQLAADAQSLQLEPEQDLCCFCV